MTGILIERCAPGFFGDDCAQTCDQCRNGECTTDRDGCTCVAGYTGLLCTEKCSPGQFGVNCAEDCNCLNGAECDPATGACKCPPGVSGEHCENGCEAGHWGDQCDKRCRVSFFISKMQYHQIFISSADPVADAVTASLACVTVRQDATERIASTNARASHMAQDV